MTKTPGGSALPPVASRRVLCSKCNAEPAKPGQRWGKVCHAAYMRGERQPRQLSAAEEKWLERIAAMLPPPRSAP